jgi:uncharacterized protein
VIVDCHTHLSRLAQWGERFVAGTKVVNPAAESDLDVTPERHWAAVRAADRAIVFGISAGALGMETPDEQTAAYVAAHPEKLIGFASVDPNDPGAEARLERAVSDLGLRGIKMSPVYQDFHPLDPRAQALYRRAERLGLPILVHAARSFIPAAPMQYASPLLYDEVARRFPDLRIVLAHLGMPWAQETAIVVRKHANVLAEVSGCVKYPWWLYTALVAMLENHVGHKILFGSDYPICTFEESLQALRSVNMVAEGTGMPRIPADVIEGIIHRDSLSLLGLE